MEALLLGTKNCLVEFSQVLDINRLFAAFVSAEAIFVDEFPNPLGSLGPSIVREKTTHSIDLLAIFGADFSAINLAIVTPKPLPVRSEGACFRYAF